MSLTTWWQQRHDPRPPSPIPEAARQVQQQAAELRKIAEDLRRSQQTREREA